MDSFSKNIAKLLTHSLPIRKGDRSSSIGISTLLCHRDVWMFFYAVESFFFQYKVTFPIFIVNDGSLTANDVHLLNSHFTIIIDEPTVNDTKMDQLLRPFPSLHRYRFDPQCNIYKKQLDVLAISPFKRTIYIDSDILFTSPSAKIINWLTKKNSDNLYLKYGPHIIKGLTNSGNPEFLYRHLLFNYIDAPRITDICQGLSLTSPITPTQFSQIDKMCQLLYKTHGLPDLYHCIEMITAPLFQPNHHLSGENFVTIDTVRSTYHISHSPKLRLIHFAYQSKPLFAQYALRLALRTNLFTQNTSI